MQRNDVYIPPAWLILWLFVLAGLAYADPIHPKLFTPEESTLLQRLALYWVVTSLLHFAELSSHSDDTRLSINRRVWQCIVAGFLGVAAVGYLRDTERIKKIGEELGVLAGVVVLYEIIVRGARAWVQNRLEGGGKSGQGKT